MIEMMMMIMMMMMIIEVMMMMMMMMMIEIEIEIEIVIVMMITLNCHHYSYSFIKVTQALDKFGDMVFQRLKMKASEGCRENDRWGKSLSGNSFTAADVPLSAKETCRNWFYKSSCIRELLPRVYIELSLFKCYRFVTDDDFGSILSRITSVIRGDSCHLHVPYCC